MVDSNEKFSESYMDLEIFSQLKIALLSCGRKHSKVSFIYFVSDGFLIRLKSKL